MKLEDVFAVIDRESKAQLNEATGEAPAEEATVAALVALELRALRLAVLDAGERPHRVRWWR